MSHDAYQPCPCGSGKRVKFCCAKHLIAELDQIRRAVEGDQRVSALDQIKRLRETHPDNPALLALHGEVLMQLGELSSMREPVERFCEVEPKNALALSQRAILSTGDGEPEQGVLMLQRAMEAVEGTMPVTMYEAFGVVAQGLLMSGDVTGSRAHFLMQSALQPDDSRPLRSILKLSSMREVPLLLKQDFHIDQPPQDVPWKEGYEQALSLSDKGNWLPACEAFERLSEQHPGQPALLYAVAALRSRLGNPARTAEAFHQYAQISQVPLNEAVQAEALAQLLVPDADVLDIVNLTWDIDDADSTHERLLAEPCLVSLNFDPSKMASEDEPPPKGVFLLLDRPQLGQDEELNRETVPRMMGQLHLYGKQTDRPARLELSVAKDSQLDKRRSKLREVLTDLSDTPGEETVGQIPLMRKILSLDWHLTQDTSPEKQRQLIEEHRRAAVLEDWPEASFPTLDGKSPRAAAGDEQYRVRVLAAILLLELGGDAGGIERGLFNELRASLGLPERETIDTEDVDINRISPSDLAYLDPAKLNDETLRDAFERASLLACHAAVRALGREFVGRPNAEFNKDTAYRMLAETATDIDEAIDFIHRGRDNAVRQNESPAKWYLQELSLQLTAGNGEEVARLVRLLESQHFNEPGIAQSTYELLAAFGLLRPGAGMPPGAQPGGPAAGPPPDAIPAAGSQPAAPEAGKIWTPGAGEPSDAGGEKKSKLWIPGMD